MKEVKKKHVRKPVSRKRPVFDPRRLDRWHTKQAVTAEGHGDCSRCRGRCCTYLTVEIQRPRWRVDLDEIRWFLSHEWVEVFVEDGEWYVQFYSRCKHLTDAGRCRIYAKRFDVCREHDASECEMSGGPVAAVVLRSPEEFDAWWTADQRRRKRRRWAARTRKAVRKTGT